MKSQLVKNILKLPNVNSNSEVINQTNNLVCFGYTKISKYTIINSTNVKFIIEGKKNKLSTLDVVNNSQIACELSKEDVLDYYPDFSFLKRDKIVAVYVEDKRDVEASYVYMFDKININSKTIAYLKEDS